MKCPKCNAGVIRASDIGSSRGPKVFCDNPSCFTWFTAPDIIQGGVGDRIIVRSGIVEDERTTTAMRSVHRDDIEAFRRFTERCARVEEEGGV